MYPYRFSKKKQFDIEIVDQSDVLYVKEAKRGYFAVLYNLYNLTSK
jgi:hypothetical protein